MSAEAGSVFPLSRLSVVDFSPLSSTNKAANPTAADTAFFCAQMWMASLHQTAPDPNPASPSASLARPYACSPHPNHPCHCTQKHWFIAAHFPTLRKPCLEHFVKTLMKSTCEWFVYLQNRNTLLSLVISLLLNKRASIGLGTDTKLLFMHGQHSPFSLSLWSFSVYRLPSHVHRTWSDTVCSN